MSWPFCTAIDKPFHFSGSCCSVAQSCLTLCDLKDCSTPGFPALTLSLLRFVSSEAMMPSNHIILLHPLFSCLNQASLDHAHAKLFQSHLTLCDPMDCSPPGSSVHGISPGKKAGVGYHFLLQGISWPRGQTAFSYLSCIGKRFLYL